MLSKFITLLFVIYFAFTSFVQAQEAEQTAKKWAIKTAPFTLLSPNYPSIQLGVECAITKRFSIEQMFGFYPNFQHIFSNHQYKTFSSRTELRYYLSKQLDQKMSASYVALEGMIAQSEYEHHAELVAKANEFDLYATHYRELLNVKRHTIRPHVKFGRQVIGKRGFVFDIFGGIGLRYEKVQHLNRVQSLDAIMVSDFPTDFTPRHNIRNDKRFNFVHGIKIGKAF